MLMLADPAAPPPPTSADAGAAPLMVVNVTGDTLAVPGVPPMGTGMARWPVGTAPAALSGTEPPGTASAVSGFDAGSTAPPAVTGVPTLKAPPDSAPPNVIVEPVRTLSVAPPVSVTGFAS